MKTNMKVLIVLLMLLATSTYAQRASCSQCSNFNCAFDGITGQCRVNCGGNYNYSVAGTLSQAPVITGGTLVSYSGSSFTVNWTCGESGGTMEVRYTNNGHNYITEGQVCICPESTGGGGQSNYCENINLNCAMDGITGPCNVLVGASANYSVSTTGTIVWKITINGSTTQLSGNPISFQWPGPGLYVAEIEVLRNGAHFTEGMVCVDTN